jgi:mono/diheme cytochrome c family protein
MLQTSLAASAAVASILVALASSPGRAEDKKELPPVADRQVDFAKDIEPILAANCIKCHGPEKQKSGYRLDSRDAAIKGGDGGAAIVPGKSAESPLVKFVAGRAAARLDRPGRAVEGDRRRRSEAEGMAAAQGGLELGHLGRLRP